MKDLKACAHTDLSKKEKLTEKLDVLLMNYHLFNLDVMEFLYKIIEEDKISEFNLNQEEFLKTFRSKMSDIREQLIAMKHKPFTGYLHHLTETTAHEKTSPAPCKSPAEVLNVFSIMMDLQKEVLSLFPVISDKESKLNSQGSSI